VCACLAQPSALEYRQICPDDTSGLAGLTAGQDFRLAPKINLKIQYNIKSYLVNIIKNNYNIVMREYIVNQIHGILIKNKKTVAVAESCTGGLLSNLLTQISGSSQYFILGVVAYSNKAKVNILRIPAHLIAKKGAVSKGIAQKMAQSIRKLAQTDFGIGITGIAGPTGATPKKPIGTVFIAINSRNKNICKRYHFKGNRFAIRKKAALKSLELLRAII